MKPTNIAVLLLLSSLTLSAGAQESSCSVNELILKGEALARKGSWQEAEKVFLLASSQEPSNITVLHDLAVSYAHSGKLAEAAECERKALAIDEGFVPAHIELACVLSLMNEHDQAREHLKRAIELEPENKIALKNLAAIKLKSPLHDRRQAAAETAKISPAGAKGKPEPVRETAVSAALVTRGVQSFKQGKLELAKRLFEQAIANCPGSINAHISLGVVLGALKDFDGQIKHERIALELDAKNSTAMCRLAWALAQKGELNEALSYYQKAVETSPQSSEAQSGQGLLLYRLGKPEAAIACLSEAVKQAPEKSDLRLAYGAVLQGLGRHEAALQELKESYRINPSNSDARTRLAALYLEAGKYAEAASHYKQLVEINPSDAELRIGYGLALLKSRELNLASQQFKKAADLDKNSAAAAHACLSMLEEMRGRLSQAEKEAKLAQELDPDSDFFKDNAKRLARSERSNEI